MENAIIVTVTNATFGNAIGYNVQRIGAECVQFFSASDFEAMMNELYYGSDLVYTAVSEVIDRLSAARFPMEIR